MVFSEWGEKEICKFAFLLKAVGFDDIWIEVHVTMEFLVPVEKYEDISLPLLPSLKVTICQKSKMHKSGEDKILETSTKSIDDLGPPPHHRLLHISLCGCGVESCS